MNKSNSQKSIDQQYLKAMNIDLWVARDTPVAAADVVTTSAAELPNTETQTDVVGEAALAQLPAVQLGAALSSMRLAASSPVQSAELLVVTEDSVLSDACFKLLTTMLKAIELKDSQWLHAGIAQAEAGSSLNELGKSMPIKAIVLMLQTGGNADALGQLRNVQHRVPGFNTPAMVTFHPQDLLDNPDAKRPAWEDLKQLRKWLA